MSNAFSTNSLVCTLHAKWNEGWRFGHCRLSIVNTTRSVRLGDWHDILDGIGDEVIQEGECSLVTGETGTVREVRPCKVLDYT